MLLLVAGGALSLAVLLWSDRDARQRTTTAVAAVNHLSVARRHTALAYLAADRRDAGDPAFGVAPAHALLDRAVLALEDWRSGRPTGGGGRIDTIRNAVLREPLDAYRASLLALDPYLHDGASPAARRSAFALTERRADALETAVDGQLRTLDRERSTLVLLQVSVLALLLVAAAIGTSWLLLARARARERDAARAAAQQEAQKLEAIGTLAGGIAHDFNNVLAAMLGHLELARDSPEHDTHREHLENVRHGIDRAAGLVRQILAFSRRADGVRLPVSLWQCAQDATRLLQASLPRNVSLRLLDAPHATARGDTAVDTVLADPAQLHQIIMNLVINAAHATNGSGTVTVSVRPLRSTDRPPLEDSTARGWVVLDVVDDGPGIPPDVLPRIFEPFFTTKAAGEGTGLGLSVVHGIVTAHGGRISVESQPGQGARFSVALPSADMPSTAPVDAIARAPQSTPLRILLVDDEPAILSSLGRALERLGHTVAPYNDARDALAAIATVEADVLLTDLSMPHLDGHRLVAAMRAQQPSAACVLMTGYGDSEGTRPDDLPVLGKPFALSELSAMLEQVRDRHA